VIDPTTTSLANSVSYSFSNPMSGGEGRTATMFFEESPIVIEKPTSEEKEVSSMINNEEVSNITTGQDEVSNITVDPKSLNPTNAVSDASVALKTIPESVKSNIIKVGDEVVRGPDWKWYNHDGGSGSRGEVTAVDVGDDRKWVVVKWVSTGIVSNYRWGSQDKYDLAVVEPAVVLPTPPTSISREPSARTMSTVGKLVNKLSKKETIPVNSDNIPSDVLAKATSMFRELGNMASKYKHIEDDSKKDGLEDKNVKQTFLPSTIKDYRMNVKKRIAQFESLSKRSSSSSSIPQQKPSQIPKMKAVVLRKMSSIAPREPPKANSLSASKAVVVAPSGSNNNGNNNGNNSSNNISIVFINNIIF